VAGVHAPQGRRMGHAGTVDLFGDHSARHKIEALKHAGAVVVDSPSLIGHAMRQALWRL